MRGEKVDARRPTKVAGAKGTSEGGALRSSARKASNATRPDEEVVDLDVLHLERVRQWFRTTVPENVSPCHLCGWRRGSAALLAEHRQHWFAARRYAFTAPAPLLRRRPPRGTWRFRAEMDAFQWSLTRLASLAKARASYPSEAIPALNILERATLHGAPRPVLDAALQQIRSIQR